MILYTVYLTTSYTHPYIQYIHTLRIQLCATFVSTNVRTLTTDPPSTGVTLRNTFMVPEHHMVM